MSELIDALQHIPVDHETKLIGVVRDQVSYHEGTRFGTYLLIDDHGHQFQATGSYPFPLRVGATYQIHGKVILYKETRTLRVEAVYAERPQTKEGVIAFLRMLHGLDRRAEMLFDRYGREVIEILLKEPEKIAEEVPGIGMKSVSRWREDLLLLQDDYHSLMELMAFGLKMPEAQKLYKTHGDAAAESIRQNPYWLQYHVRGYGFLRCEKVADKMGFSGNAPERIEAALLHLLELNEDEGHVYIHKNDLARAVRDLLKIFIRDKLLAQILAHHETDPVMLDIRGRKKVTTRKQVLEYQVRPFVQVTTAEIAAVMTQMVIANQIVFDQDNVYLPRSHQAECDAAFYIRLLQGYGVPFQTSSRGLLDALLRERGWTIEEKQREAIERFTESRGGVHILTGPPGSGKTFTLNLILEVLEHRHRLDRIPYSEYILAPTGRAAKVAGIATGRETMTIHKALGVTGFGFEHNSNNPLYADVFVIDETSMVDIHLMADLLSAISYGAKVIFIGDRDQLESVGPGSTLADIIQAGTIDYVALDVIKRQAEGSLIIQNADRILHGEPLDKASGRDAHFVRRQSDASFQSGIVESVARMVAKGHPLEDVQVLVPMKIGDCGTHVLNHLIQARVNPWDGKPRVFSRMLRRMDGSTAELYFQEGDKVMQTKNNYSLNWYDEREGKLRRRRQKGVMNGEIGIITRITEKNGAFGKSFVVTVRYQEGLVLYDNDLAELEHAFAMTIHKSQGSQWPFVILGLMMAHKRMLTNSILYTGYTRAREMLLAIGSEDAFDEAIRNNTKSHRRTTLKQQLQEAA